MAVVFSGYSESDNLSLLGQLSVDNRYSRVNVHALKFWYRFNKFEVVHWRLAHLRHSLAEKNRGGGGQMTPPHNNGINFQG